MNLVDEIINKIPNNLDNDLEKALYIYIETCKLFSFDKRLDSVPFVLNVSIVSKKANIKKINDINIVCSVWSKIYIDLLKQLNIKAKLVNTWGHYGVNIKLDGFNIYADATNGRYMDLSRVKHNDKIYGFYNVDEINHVEIPCKYYNEELENRINNFYEKIEYKFDDKLEKIKNESKKLSSLSDKMDYIIGKMDLTSYNIYDDSHYFRNVMSKCLEWDCTNIRYSFLKKTDEFGEVNLLLLIALNDNGNYTYYMFDKLSNIKKYTEEEICEYAKLGYGINTIGQYGNRDFGINYPLRFSIPCNSLTYFINKIVFKNKCSKEKILCLNK